VTPSRDVFRQATALLCDVAWVEIGAVGVDDLVALTRGLEQLGRVVDAGRAFAAGEVAERSRYEAPQVFCRSYAGCGSRLRVA
jgi:hypothetical protein